MRAMVLERPDYPLQLRQVQTPHAELGQFLIRVKARGLYHTDLYGFGALTALTVPQSSCPDAANRGLRARLEKL